MCKQKARENERLETKEWNNNRFKNPRKYWKQISMMKPRDNDCVSLSHFQEHYISLYSQDVVNINNNEYSSYNVEVESLDRQFTVSEIEHAISHIKRGKAGGDDQILSEFIYYGKQNLTRVLVDLFNMLYSTGYYPESWTTGIIVPIYKKGDRKIPGNYRGITLTSTMSKLFTFILNKRFCDWLDDANILSGTQFAYRKGYSTTDAVFVLNSIVSLKVKPSIVCCAFIDFSKAFDLIARELLYRKLKNYGISKKFLTIIMNMYSKDKSKVRTNAGCSDVFNLTK